MIPIDKFYKLTDILQVFWFIKRKGPNEFVLRLLNRIYKISYFEDLLVYHILENFVIKGQTIAFDTNFIFVPPLLKEIEDYALMNASEVFSFEHKYLATTIWDGDVFKAPFIQRIDSLPQAESNLAIITEGEKFRIAFKVKYLDELKEICHAHFDKKIGAIALL